ncbi:MAG: hypothetical protein GOV01_03490 [Candidatus Altiarchaeota archaeon]|nr:hypothetical protein [Candidatus Altiarchaeota archaeon]
MGIVRKILGEETPIKKDLLTIKDSVEGELSDASEALSMDKEEELTTETLIPKGIEMFVRITDYNKIVSQLKRLESVIDKLEEIEGMHSELQDVHDKFTERLEVTLTEVEEIKDALGSKFGPVK